MTTARSEKETALRALWTSHGVPAARQDELVAAIIATPVPTFAPRPAEDLTPEGLQLVIPGAERRMPASAKQYELF